jgi:predicted dehydrogenase
MALIGCGRISASHLDAIHAQPSQGRLVAVVDTDMARARDVAARFGVDHAFDDPRRALDLEDVEAVCICTPNALHAEQSLMALEAGRHVLLEKPMAETLAEATAMAEAADRTGLVLALGHTLRHTAPIRHLQDHRADFGALRAVEVSQCVFWDGPQAPWWKTRTPKAGLILSLLAPHALDFVQLAMDDDDPVSVQALAARHQSGWAAEDEAMILLGYSGGRMASIHLSYNQPFIVDRKTLSFEKAVIRIEDGDELWIGDTLTVSSARSPTDNRRIMGGRDLSPYFHTQFREFVRAVRGRSHRSVLHREGLRLTGLTEAVIRAAGRPPIGDWQASPEDGLGPV